MKVLKLLEKSDNCYTCLSRLINYSFEHGTFPKEWKEGRVIPILKPGDRENVDNYRPVSVLNRLSKVCERIVFNALYYFLVQEDLLHKLQSSFRHFHSTATSLIDMIDSIYENLDNGNISGALFLDLRKVFDTVNHRVLASQ